MTVIEPGDRVYRRDKPNSDEYEVLRTIPVNGWDKSPQTHAAIKSLRTGKRACCNINNLQLCEIELQSK